MLMVNDWATLNLLFYLFALVRFKDSPFEKSIKVTCLALPVATEVMSMSGFGLNGAVMAGEEKEH